MDATELRRLERLAGWRARDQAIWWLRHGGYRGIREDDRDDRIFWMSETLVEDALGITMLNARWQADNCEDDLRLVGVRARELRDQVYVTLRAMTAEQLDAIASRIVDSARGEEGRS